MNMDRFRGQRVGSLMAAVTFGVMMTAGAPGPASASRLVARLRRGSTAPARVALRGSSPLPALVPPGHVPVLMYHYIRVNPNPRDGLGFRLSVTPSDFQRQMQWAKDHGFHTITMTDLYQALATGSSVDSRSFILTFDDGHADFYTAALPVLRRYGFTATAYIVPGFLGRPDYMTWQQVLDIDRMGFNIGAHTLTHPDLTKLPPAAAQAQISGSKAELESRLGHPVDDFCYPSGRYSPAVLNLVRSAGFRDATTTRFGAFESPGSAFSWPRVRISGTDRLSGFISNLLSGVAAYQGHGAGAPPSPAPSPPRPSASPTTGSAGLDRVADARRHYSLFIG